MSNESSAASLAAPSSTGAMRAPLAERGDDCYETPSEAVHALLQIERLPRFLWEPACGPGRIVDVLRAAGHKVIGSDLVDYGNPTHFYGRDFLLEWKAPERCEGIVTNPPFKLAEQFVEHALDLCPLAVFLLRLGFIEGVRVRRSRILGRHLARLHVFANRLPHMHRQNWDGRRAGSRTAFAWFVFLRDHRDQSCSTASGGDPRMPGPHHELAHAHCWEARQAATHAVLEQRA